MTGRDFPNRKDIESCTHGGQKHLETVLSPRESGSASAPDESPCLPSQGGTIFVGNAAAPHTHYGITAMNIRARTVSHYDTDKRDRILTIGKLNNGNRLPKS